MMCALIARGKFKPQLEFQAGTSSFFLLSGSYQLVPRTLDYKCEKYGVCRSTRDHLYNTQNSERSDEVSTYLIVTCVQVPVRKLLLLLMMMMMT